MTSPAGDLKDVDVADVYKAGVRAGWLRRTSGAVEFGYDDEYRAARLPAVAWTLPLDGGPVTRSGGAVPPFFAGLLPEGRRLSVLRRVVKTSVDDELTLLLGVGRDTVGDVQVVPAGTAPAPAEPAVTVTDWAEVSFEELVARSVGDESTEVDPAAVPGVQAKLSGRVLSLPVGRSDQRWILKLDPPEFPHLVENEAFFLSAAAEVGLPVAESHLVRDAEGRAGLLVRRFDRAATADGVRSLAQEDACQVLGRYPADKYSVGAEVAVRALAACTRSPSVASRSLFRQLVFAYLTGDGDVHAKNLSVGATIAGEWRATPAYDLPSTRPYGDTTMALSMGRRRDGLSRRSFLAFAAEVGVTERAAARVLDDLSESADGWIPRLGELPFDEGRIRDLTRLARHRQGALRRG